MKRNTEYPVSVLVVTAVLAVWATVNVLMLIPGTRFSVYPIYYPKHLVVTLLLIIIVSGLWRNKLYAW